MNRATIGEDDFNPGGNRPGVFLKPRPMKKSFAEYERWMLERPAETGDSTARWRELRKTEVERLAAALAASTPFNPYRGSAKPETEEPCSTSSVTT